MTAVVLWTVLKVLFTIGIGVGVICWMIFTKDGRTFSAWMLGIGAALGIASLIPILIGAAFIAIVIYVLMIFI
ncbi:hypothetical protein N9L88_04325 [Candidatus Pelagibacter bacterium]|nr:hypothetical protein [Candidatus Pelagibacter bacterium]